MVVDRRVVHDIVHRREVLTYGLSVATLDQGGIGEDGVTALEIEKSGGAIKMKINFLPVEEVIDRDIVFAESEMLERFAERFWGKRKSERITTRARCEIFSAASCIARTRPVSPSALRPPI
jgi:hypothetical protein